ncbi:MAG: hypothetical protein ACERLM_15115 [Acidimicrobiales bacterium]
MSTESQSEPFWETAEPLMAEGILEEGTIMGGRCVRTTVGEFVGMPNHEGPGLVVKLSRDRVDELIGAGRGQSFAPAGKVFKEWVLVEDHDAEEWDALLRESVAFVS